MHYCLSKSEFCKLLDIKLHSKKLSEDDSCLLAKIESSENWYDELSFMNYHLSHIIESNLKQDNYYQNLLEFVYSLRDKMWLLIEEVGVDFIDIMLKSYRNENLTLEENLIELQNCIGNHKYEQIIRD